MSSFIQEYERQIQERASRISGLKADLRQALAAAGVHKAIVAYDAYGDSGQVEEIALLDAAGKEIAATTLAFKPKVPWDIILMKTPTLRDALNSFAWELLCIHHDGFENCDGGFGTIVFDVTSGKIVLDHNDRFTDCINTVTEV